MVWIWLKADYEDTVAWWWAVRVLKESQAACLGVEMWLKQLADLDADVCAHVQVDVVAVAVCE